MKLVVGFVCEGPRDVDLLVSVIDHLIPEAEIIPRYLQPDESLISIFANGWKGVWRWCNAYGKDIDAYAKGIFPQLDMLIVHMDGDVSRTERTSHCNCSEVSCIARTNTIPPDCDNNKCPIVLPCELHEESPRGYALHLRSLLSEMFPMTYQLPIIIVVPCDSTDAWIVAALEDFENMIDYESIKKPWDTIIAHKKYYHNLKISRNNKSKVVYTSLIEQMVNNWEKVTLRCEQADCFQKKILRIRDSVLDIGD